MTDERLKQLMVQVGLPDSVSLMGALKQAYREGTVEERERAWQAEWDKTRAYIYRRRDDRHTAYEILEGILEGDHLTPPTGGEGT
jgi:hypothetical protein